MFTSKLEDTTWALL